MKLLTLFNGLCTWMYDYNLFMPDVIINDESEDRTVPLKRQKQATWLYVFFLLISLYILFYITMIKPESQIITITQITPEIFDQLRLKYASTLSCPCTTITMPYKTFLNSAITLHPVCSSLFVSEQWINALYRSDSSLYSVTDFRTIGYAQFRILARLCSLSTTIMDQNKNDLDYNELITKDLLTEEHIQAKVNASTEFLKNSLASRMISFLDYFRTMIHANYFISALNTNAIIQLPSSALSFIATALRTTTTDKLSVIHYCSVENPISSAGFSASTYNTSIIYQPVWQDRSAQLINGFFGSCTPLEGLLVSTLDCLYDSNCIQSWFDYFPSLRQFNSSLNSSILSLPQTNSSVYDNFNNLFVEEWFVKINYSIYFQQCAPSFCTYITTNRTNFVTALALLISLYGGLTIILRLIAPSLIYILTKIGHCSIRMNMRNYFQQLKQVNLFPKENKREQNDIKQQIIATRIYLVLLIISFLILLLFTSFATEVTTVEISKPSYDTYQNLQILHENTLECSCSNITIAYQEFIKLVPSFHQICSSSFVTQSWFTILNTLANQKISIDWLNQIPSQFQLLLKLCQLANQTITNSIHQLMKQSLITSNLLTKSEVDNQMNIILNEFFQSTLLHFGLVVDILRLLTQVDQPFMGIAGNSLTPFETNIYGNHITNLTNGQQSVQFKFFLTGTKNINTTLVECICATNPYCQSSVAIYDLTYTTTSNYYYSVDYIVPGFVRGCSIMNSLLYSTLECFYQDSQCYSIVINYIKTTYFQTMEYPAWFDIKPLVYDPVLTSYLPNTTINTLVKQLLIEKWNPSILYEKYYQICAPVRCIYTETARSRTTIGVITVFISMLGGLTISLRLLVPLLVKCVFYVMEKIRRRSQDNSMPIRNNQANNGLNRLKMISKKIIMKLIDLNIFHLNDFQSTMNRMQAKELGKWATRLFICLYTIVIVVLVLYTLIHPRMVTKTFPKPSFTSYLQLKQKYDNRLECSCSSIAFNYDKFVHLKPVFHPICSSSIITDEWRVNLTGQLMSNLSIYNERDYRRFLSAHLQLLSGLCQLSIQSINDTVNQFLSSVFITDQLLSENDFHIRLNSSIVQIISNAPITLTRLFYLIQDINHGNAIVSNYGTNYKHLIPIYQVGRIFAQTEGHIYDDHCACDQSLHCTSQAYFMTNDTFDMIGIKGLKIGCTPSGSFRASTLECFYDPLCLQLIQNYTQSTHISIPFLTTPTHFSINTTIVELINDLFVDEWSIDTNYSSYFQFCLPQFCSYTYIQQLNILYVITLILGLQGGLTIGLRWICPKLVQFTYKINQYRIKKRNLIQSNCAVDTAPFPSNSSNNSDNSMSDIEPYVLLRPSTTTSSIQYSMKMILICVFSLFITILAIVLFSIYFVANQNENETNIVESTHVISSTISLSTNTSMFTTSMNTSSSTTAMICQIQFQSVVVYENQSRTQAYSPVIVDFNNDQRLDIAFLQGLYGNLIILLQDSNQNFSSRIIIPVGCTDSFNSFDIKDINNDSLPDIVGICGSSSYIYILLTNKNGTFDKQVLSLIGNNSMPSGIIIEDFNHDSHLDIAISQVAANSISVLVGYGNGTFSNPVIFSTGRNSFPRAIALADFNGDDYQDLAVVNYMSRSIGIFLSYNNGSFQDQRTFFTGGGSLPFNFAISDLNNDNILDVVCSYQRKTSISILYGYGNGNLSEIRKIPLQLNSNIYTSSIAIADLNLDNYTDIIIGHIDRGTIYVLIADQHGNFQQQTVFSFNFYVYQLDIAIADLNNDGYPDIIATTYQGYTVNIFFNTGRCFNVTNA